MTNVAYLKWCFLSLLVGGVVMAQQGPVNEVGRLPGTALRWIHTAEPVFAEKNLKVENYTVVVVEHGDEVTVYLTSNPSPNDEGSTGPFPGYEVTLRKKTGKILKQAYTR